jgi:hypothetical protein
LLKGGQISWISGPLHLSCETNERPLSSSTLRQSWESNLSISDLKMSREDGVIMLTFPPHTSH